MSNLNLNKVVLAGRLTADPELRQTPSGVSVIRVSLAINRRRGRNSDGEQQQQTDFITIVAWRQTAEFISKYFRKGSAICVTGSIQTSSWNDQQGQKRYSTEVVVDEAMFVDSRNEGDTYSPESYTQAPSYSSNSDEDKPDFKDQNTDDDLPF